MWRPTAVMGRVVTRSREGHAAAIHIPQCRENTMAESVYRITELVGTSTESWEKAASTAVETAAKSLRDLRIAEVAELDLQLEDGQVKAYRARVKVSFKYEGGS